MQFARRFCGRVCGKKGSFLGGCGGFYRRQGQVRQVTCLRVRWAQRLANIMTFPIGSLISV